MATNSVGELDIDGLVDALAAEAEMADTGKSVRLEQRGVMIEVAKMSKAYQWRVKVYVPSADVNDAANKVITAEARMRATFGETSPLGGS